MEPLFEAYYENSCKSLGIVQEGLGDMFRNIWESVVKFFRNLWNGIVKMYNTAITTIKNWFKKLLGVDTIEKENADLKVQIQQMKDSDEKSKKELAEANAKLKETEEQIKDLHKLVRNKEEERDIQADKANKSQQKIQSLEKEKNYLERDIQDIRASDSQQKIQSLEKEKKCLEKYIEYIEYANREFRVGLDSFKVDEIITILRQSYSSIEKLHSRCFDILYSMEKSENFEDFINQNFQNTNPDTVTAYEIIDNFDYRRINDMEKKFTLDEEGYELNTLNAIEPSYLKVKNIKFFYTNALRLLNRLEEEFKSIKKINIDSDFNTTFAFRTFDDEKRVEMARKIAKILCEKAKKREEVNKNIIIRVMNLIKNFGTIYKDMKDINFNLKYDKFKERYLDDTCEFTPDLKKAIDSIDGTL